MRPYAPWRIFGPMAEPPSQASTRATPSPGDVLRGKYRVERVLGAGGMGVVLLAHDLRLDRPVAIKLLRPNPSEPHATERFAREARAAARVQSEHVVRILDVDEIESGQPFIVMEYLEGTDLERQIKQRGGLPVPEAIDYLLQTCEGVAEVHAAGIIHRDLKPSNLFLVKRRDGTPCVKLVDFGISKPLESVEEMALTDTEWIVGSPMYMAPEQLRHGRDVDLRTDVWALGLVLYRLLTGKHAFEAQTRPAIILRIASDEPTPLRTLRPDAPPELEAVILKCLAKDRAARFARVEELVAALAPLLGEPRGVVPRALSSSGGRLMPVLPLPSSSVAEIETVSASGPLGSTTAAQVSQSSQETGPQPGVWTAIAIGVAAGVLAAGVGAGVWRLTRTPTVQQRTTAAPVAPEASGTPAGAGAPAALSPSAASPMLQTSASAMPPPRVPEASASIAASAPPAQHAAPRPRAPATPPAAPPSPAEPKDPLDIGLK